MSNVNLATVIGLTVIILGCAATAAYVPGAPAWLWDLSKMALTGLIGFLLPSPLQPKSP